MGGTKAEGRSCVEALNCILFDSGDSNLLKPIKFATKTNEDGFS